MIFVVSMSLLKVSSVIYIASGKSDKDWRNRAIHYFFGEMKVTYFADC